VASGSAVKPRALLTLWPTLGVRSDAQPGCCFADGVPGLPEPVKLQFDHVCQFPAHDTPQRPTGPPLSGFSDNTIQNTAQAQNGLDRAPPSSH
jgi:hypothetical protein